MVFSRRIPERSAGGDRRRGDGQASLAKRQCPRPRATYGRGVHPENQAGSVAPAGGVGAWNPGLRVRASHRADHQRDPLCACRARRAGDEDLAVQPADRRSGVSGTNNGSVRAADIRPIRRRNLRPRLVPHCAADARVRHPRRARREQSQHLPHRATREPRPLRGGPARRGRRGASARELCALQRVWT
jgi:hypothetical protein